VRTGGVEPPQHEAAGLQPVELTDALRPQGMSVKDSNLRPLEHRGGTHGFRHEPPSFQRDTLRRRRHARERLAAASWPTALDGRTPEWKAKRAREKTLRRRSRHARERLAAGLVANGARRAHTRAESEAGEGKWGDRPDSNRYREAHNLGCSPLHHGHHERGRPDSNRQPLA
jgi:hypothetical protein